jgi:hypothetical protein
MKDFVDIPEESIPKNWTGKTPKVMLEEWCRKEKLPKPNFQKMSMNGCRLRVQLKNKSTSDKTILVPVAALLMVSVINFTLRSRQSRTDSSGFDPKSFVALREDQ